MGNQIKIETDTFRAIHSQIDNENVAQTSSDKKNIKSKTLADLFAKDEIASATKPDAFQSLMHSSPPHEEIPLLDAPAYPLQDIPNDFAKIPAIEQHHIECLHKMSDQTLEAILLLLLQFQMEVQKHNLQDVESSAEKFYQLKGLQAQLLRDIKETLLKDEQILGYAKTTQTVVDVACVLSSAAALALGFGLIPASASLGLLASVCVSAVHILGSVGPVVTGLSSGLIRASKFYCEESNKQHKAAYESIAHHDKRYEKQIEATQDHMQELLQSHTSMQEKLSQILKKIRETNQLILQNHK